MILADLHLEWTPWLLAAPFIAWMVIGAFIGWRARKVAPKFTPSKKLKSWRPH